MEKNREIKYKSLYRGQWYNVKELSLDNGNIYPTQFEGENFSPDLEHVKCTVQYTGLLDKNGKEIYCGDVFDIGQAVNGCSKFVIVDCIGCYDVRYAFDLEYKYQYDIKELLSIEEIEIVGHTYENPTNNI